MDWSRFSENDNKQTARRKSLAAAYFLEGGMEMGPVVGKLIPFLGQPTRSVFPNEEQ